MNDHYDDPKKPQRESYRFPKLRPGGSHRRGPVPKTREEANFEALQQRKRKEKLVEKYRDPYKGKHRQKGE